MMMPPPPKRRLTPPPPPPQQPISPIYSPDLSPFDREAAVWTFGGYPQRSHDSAEVELMRKCMRAGFEWIGPAAIFTLEMELYDKSRDTAVNA